MADDDGLGSTEVGASLTVRIVAETAGGGARLRIMWQSLSGELHVVGPLTVVDEESATKLVMKSLNAMYHASVQRFWDS